jgi:phosphoribosylanthranilate isomerase
MPLKTLVKVGCITNLSDARYCAGMGVDLLGFRVIAGSEHHIDHTLFQQIRGWLSGPKIVAECYGISEKTNITEIISQFAPDYIELNLQ